MPQNFPFLPQPIRSPDYSCKMLLLGLQNLSNVIVHGKINVCSVNQKASISINVSAFSFIFIGYLFTDLSSSTIEKFA